MIHLFWGVDSVPKTPLLRPNVRTMALCCTDARLCPGNTGNRQFGHNGKVFSGCHLNWMNNFFGKTKKYCIHHIFLFSHSCRYDIPERWSTWVKFNYCMVVQLFQLSRESDEWSDRDSCITYNPDSMGNYCWLGNLWLKTLVGKKWILLKTPVENTGCLWYSLYIYIFIYLFSLFFHTYNIYICVCTLYMHIFVACSDHIAQWPTLIAM